jgi:hypothetical protein
MSAGGSAFFSHDIVLVDNGKVTFGGGSDLQIYHDGSNNYIHSTTSDQDINFLGNDGGSTITALTLDMSAAGAATFNSNISAGGHVYVTDGNKFIAGSGEDLQIYHDATDSLINNSTGHLYLTNYADNKDIYFRSDDGSGGVAVYFYVGGTAEQTIFVKDTEHQDSTKARFGNSGDMSIYHDSSNSYLTNTTGNLYIMQRTDDGDMSFQCDDGSGGDAEYFRLDGGVGYTIASKDIRFDDSVKVRFGTGLDAYIQHNGTNTTFHNETGNLEIINGQDDGDIYFSCDDGSGGLTDYYRIDGANHANRFYKNLALTDDTAVYWGNSNDFYIKHNATNTEVINSTGNLLIENYQDDGDIVFKSDNGSGGIATYMTVDGGDERVNFAKNAGFSDSAKAIFGDGLDLRVYHDGSSSHIENHTSNLTLTNYADDGDIILRSDDGSGGHTTYLTLDGGLGYTTVQKDIRFDDNVDIKLGTSNDCTLMHDGTNTYIDNGTGALVIRNQQDDGDIIFYCDDGSGGLTEYIRIDGSSNRIDIPDSIPLCFGAGDDLQIQHNGSQSYIQNFTGDLQIQNNADDGDVLLRCDDGSGGLATYMYLDGGNTRVQFNKDARFVDDKKVMLGTGDDLQLYHDATDSIIKNTVGHLYISNSADDKDIIFQCDDSSGGLTDYYRIDGANHANRFYKNLALTDDTAIYWGNSNDFYIKHNATNTEVINSTGHLYIDNYADNKDIYFRSDDGSGGIATYFYVGGTAEQTIFVKDTEHQDGAKAQFGNIGDMQIYHDSNHSYLINGTGNLYIAEAADDSDMHFQCDDGSGGLATYFYLDGSLVNGSSVLGATRFPDKSKIYVGTGGDLEMFHDGTNSYMTNGTGNLYLDVTGSDDMIFRFKSNDTAMTIDGGATSIITSVGLQANSTITVGVDDTGHDVKFFGASSGSYMLWDQSLDRLVIVGTMTISGDGSNASTFEEHHGGALDITVLDDLTFDITGDIVLDADGGDIRLKDGGTAKHTISMQSGGDTYFVNETSNADVLIRGNDGGSTITAVTFDMSDAGKATFNNDVIAFSDRKLKKDIKTLDGSKVYDMRGVGFTRKDTNLPGAGVIAQEMQEVAPELVTETNDTLGVSYGNLTGYLIEAIKDLKAEIEELKKCKKCDNCNCENK